MAQPEVWLDPDEGVYYTQYVSTSKPDPGGLTAIGTDLICLQSGILYKWNGEAWIGLGV